jgi:hypothetical protein
MSDQGRTSTPPPPPPPNVEAAPTESAKTSGLAITSIILGVLGFVTCGVTSLVGLVLGIVGLTQIKGSGGRLKGDGLAIGGICVSGVSLIAVPFIAILAGMLLPALGRARAEARKVRCASNLDQIAKGANMWLLKYGDNTHWPPSLKALMDDGIIVEPKVFLCPACDTAPAPGEFVTDYECVLDLVDGKVAQAETMDVPFAWDKKGNHHDGVNVVYFDSHVEFESGPDAYERVRQKVEAWLAERRAKER